MEIETIYNIMYGLILGVGICTIALGVNLLSGKRPLFKSAVTPSPMIRKASAALIITIGVEWLYDVILAASITTDEQLVQFFGIANMLDGITFETVTYIWLFSLLQPKSLKPYLTLILVPMAIPLIMLACYTMDPQESYYEAFTNFATIYILVMAVFFIFSVRKYNRLLTENYTNHKNKNLRPLYYSLAMYFVAITINSIAFNGHSETRNVQLTLLDIAAFVALTLFIIWIAETQQMIVRRNGMPVGYVPNLLQCDKDGHSIAERIEEKLTDRSVVDELLSMDDLSMDDVSKVIGYDPAYLLCYLEMKHTTFEKYFNALKTTRKNLKASTQTSLT